MVSIVHPNVATQSVRLPAGAVELNGDIALPERALGIVVFAHGSGSSRHSPRNRFVAQQLNQGYLGTLLMDLLTPQEEQVDINTAEFRFDVSLLAHRLAAATDWLGHEPATRGLPIGYFGASTGAAAALMAAARRPEVITAVVSRGGRPDLADKSLPLVRSPTLLIVGGEDPIVIELNQQAMKQMQCEKRLEIIPGATHLFEETGALEQVAQLALQWFSGHFAPGSKR